MKPHLKIVKQHEESCVKEKRHEYDNYLWKKFSLVLEYTKKNRNGCKQEACEQRQNASDGSVMFKII